LRSCSCSLVRFLTSNSTNRIFTSIQEMAFILYSVLDQVFWLFIFSRNNFSFAGNFALFEWKKNELSCERNVNDKIHAIEFLHNHQMFAFAQSEYAYIYDLRGMFWSILFDGMSHWSWRVRHRAAQIAVSASAARFGVPSLPLPPRLHRMRAFSECLFFLFLFFLSRVFIPVLFTIRACPRSCATTMWVSASQLRAFMPALEVIAIPCALIRLTLLFTLVPSKVCAISNSYFAYDLLTRQAAFRYLVRMWISR
jgi:hypothetical protein